MTQTDAHEDRQQVPETRPILPGLSGFDRTIAYAILGVLLLIGFTLLLGDRVGVTLARVAPLGVARATSPIIIQFSDPMARDSVPDKLRIEPAVAGDFNWNGATLIFTPAHPLEPGVDYRVTLMPGAVSESGRPVLAEYRFSFSVRRPRVAYLAPADGTPLNVWAAEPGRPESTQQLTFTTDGVYDFAISPDGGSLAYSESNMVTDTEDIMLLDLETNAIRQLTNCADASCTNPTWRPDGRLIAYERIDYNTGLENVGPSPTRVWLLDPTTSPATTYPLFADTQILGYNPQWSADGERIAVFDRSSASIFIWDFGTETGIAVPSDSGTSGALSPDGQLLVFPEVRLVENEQTRTYLQVADLNANTIEPLLPADDTGTVQTAVWNPDGTLLAVGQRFAGGPFNVGYQIILVNPDTDEMTPLTNDDRYTNGFFSWDAGGEQLVIQRLPLLDEQGQPDNLARPEIWTLDVRTGALTEVARNAFHPRWMP